MHARLDYIKLTPKRVLDAGCGSGEDLALLQARFPAAQLIGLDISNQMLSKILNTINTGIFHPCMIWGWIKKLLRQGIGRKQKAAGVVQGDLNQMPFAPSSFELLWSNLVLPWQGPFPSHAEQIDNPSLSHEEILHPLARLFHQWQHVLSAQGLLMFSTLGPDSLQELRQAWAKADATNPQARVLDFADMHDLGDMLVHSGFENPVMDMEKLTLTYRSAEALLQDVRRWGAYPASTTSDIAAQRPTGLTGKKTYQALLAALEAQRNAEGVIPLTFEVVYGHAWRRATSMSSDTVHDTSPGEFAPMRFYPRSHGRT